MSLAHPAHDATGVVVDDHGDCPECDGDVHREGTEQVCQDCGLVVATDPLDRGPEWRTMTVDDPRSGDPRRTGAPRTVSRHDRGLSTHIGHQGDLRTLAGCQQRKVHRLRREHHRAHIGSKKSRNEVYALTEIRRITSVVCLPDGVRDQACRLFQQAHAADALQGRGLDGFAAATVYAAGRRSRLARTFDEIAAAARVDRRTVRTCYLALVRTLDLPIGPPRPHEYLPRLASSVDAPYQVEQHARELLADAADEAVTGRKPQGVAAAALYAVSEGITQAALADASDVTPPTIRDAVQALQEASTA